MKERLIKFLTYLKMGQNSFEEKVGLSRGFVNKVGDSIREKNLHKIITHYPELNVNWLKTGEGSMLKKESNNIKQSVTAGKNAKHINQVANAPTEDLVEIIRKKDEQIDKLLEIIKQIKK
jgi:hypothetical protein